MNPSYSSEFLPSGLHAALPLPPGLLKIRPDTILSGKFCIDLRCLLGTEELWGLRDWHWCSFVSRMETEAGDPAGLSLLTQRRWFWTLQFPAAPVASLSSSEQKYRVCFGPELEKEALAQHITDWAVSIEAYVMVFLSSHQKGSSPVLEPQSRGDMSEWK